MRTTLVIMLAMIGVLCLSTLHMGSIVLADDGPRQYPDPDYQTRQATGNWDYTKDPKITEIPNPRIEYDVIQLSLNYGVGWCVKTNAPAGIQVAMNIGAGKNRYTWGTVSLQKLDSGETLLCSDYFKYSESWNDKFPVRLIYNLGGPKAVEVVLNGFKK